MTKHLKWIANKLRASPDEMVRDFGKRMLVCPFIKVTCDVLPSSGEDLTALFDLALNEYEHNLLPLPFTEFTLEFEGMFVRVKKLINIGDEGHHYNATAIGVFFVDEGDVAAVTAMGIIAEGHPFVLHWMGPNFEVPSLINEDDQSAINYAFYILIATLTLIRMSYARTETVDVREENKRRIRMKRAPLPEQRIVVIDTENVSKVVFRKGGTHTSPIGHLRRSHIRRLQSGKIVTVSASSVRGGPTTHHAHYVIQ